MRSSRFAACGIPTCKRLEISTVRSQVVSYSRYAHVCILTDIHVLLQAEEQVNKSTRNKFFELFTVPRNRRATLASSIVMFMQVSIHVQLLMQWYTDTQSMRIGNSSAA